MHWLGTEAPADGPWERTWSSCMETTQKAWAVVWVKPQSPLSALTEQGQVQQQNTWLAYMLDDTTETHVSGRQLLGRSTQLFIPGRSTPVPPTSNHSLEPALGQAGPGKGLTQRQPRCLLAAKPPQFLQPQNPRLQHQPTWQHSLALGLHKHNKERDATLGCFWAEPRMPAQAAHRFTVTTGASLASVLTSFGIEHVLKGNGGLSNLTLRALLQQLGRRLHPQKG